MLESRQRKTRTTKVSLSERQPLGRGGMATTSLAWRIMPSGIRQRVCIKEILPELRADKEFVYALSQECRIGASLLHPNIVQLISTDFDPEEPALIMEYVEGVDLNGLIRALTKQGRKLDDEIVDYVLYEIAAALAHAHSKDIVHRDLSPSNVLLSRQGEVKLGDFGIARALEATQHKTETVRGKLAYMPPEYVRGGEFSKRSDLFAFGVMGYQLMDGYLPFREKDPRAHVAAVKAAEYQPLASNAFFAQWIPELLKPNPEERNASAYDMVAQVESTRSLVSGALALSDLLESLFPPTHRTPKNDPEFSTATMITDAILHEETTAARWTHNRWDVLSRTFFVIGIVCAVFVFLYLLL